MAATPFSKRAGIETASYTETFLLLASLLASRALGSNSSSRVYGIPAGFAYSFTGGGNVTPAIPANVTQLRDWLTDNKPRVIVLDKEYNFIGSEGYCENCACCVFNTDTCGEGGQDAIETDFGWRGDRTPVDCTYPDTTTIDVAISITDNNPGYVLGGDAIYMNGCDLIWIDHVTISLVGRQMIFMGYESIETDHVPIGGRVTTSNTEFDGRTDHSATCDGRHYWTILGLGENDKVSFFNNWIHRTSARSADLGSVSAWHIFNTYWSNNTGHAFSVTPEPAILVEGNVFTDVVRPTEPGNGYGMFLTNSSTISACDSTMGRPCQENVLTGSGDLSPYTTNNVTSLQTIGDADGRNINFMPIGQVRAYVVANAGIGKVGFNGTTTPTILPSGLVVTPPSTAVPYQVQRNQGHGHQYVRFHHRHP
ncbi:pectin lyase fold/virulence factor [Aspergillus pseudonomiae]|uniref:pectin lyase n=1 Tax=Aspergillus pseudonomiae TaxID=1506151 RepID=A0A5N7DEF2_9EURO|nr:pectin lyase fold/virulence factor [Aspergillus pseudonomiae]KAE8404836.1 pectin lyase fold/virulence factor [Aspergillus pseudonomiae]